MHRQCALLAATLALLPLNGHSEEKSEPSKTLIELWHDANGRCRGGSGDSPMTEAACAERARYGARLEALGRCYGRRGQIGAELVWHVCQPDSIHAEGVPSKTQAARQDADPRSFFIGRWYLSNPKVCTGVVGEAEGLFVYTMKKAIAYESTCEIVAMNSSANRIGLKLKCSSEGMDFAARETVQLTLNGHLARTTYEDGAGRTIEYARCP